MFSYFPDRNSIPNNTYTYFFTTYNIGVQPFSWEGAINLIVAWAKGHICISHNK